MSNLRKFNREDIIFTPLVKIGPVQPGPAGAMADYSITAHWDGISKEMAFKVLHDVMHPQEPDPFMYETAREMAVKALSDIMEREANLRARDEMFREHMSGKPIHDRVSIEDISFSEVQHQRDRVFIVGTFLGHHLSANTEVAAFKQAEANGHVEKVIEDMKFSILHAFRSSYDRINGPTGLN